MMLQIGQYQFSLQTASPEEVSRRTSYDWAQQPRLGREPALQFTGLGDDQQDLRGTIFPYYWGGLGQLDAMRTEAGKGEPLELVDGLGNVHGLWVITEVEETRKVLSAEGVPRRIDFRLQIKRYGEDAA